VAKPQVMVTFAPSSDLRDALRETLDGVADVAYLPDLGEGGRTRGLGDADAVLSWDIDGELRGPEEFDRLSSVGLVQLLSAGADRVPFDRLAADVRVASNAGAYAEPMAEHVLAMALALAKRLPQNHAALLRGEFDQRTPTRAIRGAVVGVLGFGGIGQATARLFGALGARIHAVNTSGGTDAPVDWIGTLDDLDALLGVADVIVVSLPLTRVTRGLIGARQLALTKPDAILVNVARGAIVDEDALYEHLVATPSFSAGIDAWWQEPRWDGGFVTRHPFLDLPNVIGSPHNSALTASALRDAARRAAENIARHLRGERAQHLVDRSDYVG
jgi:phosphoglycerate dehydrogenase-like enzyme